MAPHSWRFPFPAVRFCRDYFMLKVARRRHPSLPRAALPILLSFALFVFAFLMLLAFYSSRLLPVTSLSNLPSLSFGCVRLPFFLFSSTFFFSLVSTSSTPLCYFLQIQIDSLLLLLLSVPSFKQTAGSSAKASSKRRKTLFLI